jgi:hypothetical protein
MADRAALEAAAAAGVISAEQVGSLDAFLNAQAPKPALAGGLPPGILDSGSFEGRMLLAVAEFCRENPEAQGVSVQDTTWCRS